MKYKLYICLPAFYLFSKVSGVSSGECRDLNGRIITQDMHYVPGPDACTLCICDNGLPKWCKAVLCSPPQDCKSFRVGNSCCEFICLDDTLSKGDGIADFGTDVGLRLIVSAIIAILSLCLLFFLVHRLRQRKIRGRQNRQLSEDERSLGSIGYITGSLGYLPQNYFNTHGGPERHLEFRYEEPPTHLSFWKPSGNYFPRGEAPPPYEEAVSQRNEISISTSNTLPNMSHRTIPLNLTTTGTIRLVNPSSARESTTISQSDPERNRSQSNSNILQVADHGRTCTIENSNTLGRSVVNSLAIRNDSSSLNRIDFNANTVIRNTIPLPRNAVKQMSSTNFVNLRQNLEKDKPITAFNSNSNGNVHAQVNLDTSSDTSTLRYEININRNSRHNEENRSTLRKNGRGIQSTPVGSEPDAAGNEDGRGDWDRARLNSFADGVNSKPKDAAPQLTKLSKSDDPTVIRSDALYDNVMVGMSPSAALIDATMLQNEEENFDDEKGSEETLNDEERQQDEDEDVISNRSDCPLTAVYEEVSSTDHDLENEPSSCDCSSYQCLTNNDDNDDYRSECENCKSGPGSSFFLDEDPEPPETMTLQRVPKETDEFENQEHYYRTSLTLPTNSRKPRITQNIAGARENWFSSMPESGSSSEEE